MSKSAAERALKYLRQVPRLSMYDLRDNPGARTKGRQVRSKDNRCGHDQKELAGSAKPPLGWIWGDFYKPWQRLFPGDPQFNIYTHLKREYPPMSLVELQRLIDLGWIDVFEPIDLSTLCITKRYRCKPINQQFGVHLTDQGADIFAAKVNIEVQWASETAIAAIERMGGHITTAYFDPISLEAMIDPLRFFKKGEPIPKRSFPPADLMEYYSDPKFRGYLADPDKVATERIELSQKYGYTISTDEQPLKKDPLQIFHGLEPGWVVNLQDKTILKPKDPEIINYYNS